MRANNGRRDKPYVLTQKDAWALLASASNYVHTPNRKIDGKEQADILAEATLSRGLSDLANSVAAIHSSVMRFHKGDYRAIQYLLETPAIGQHAMQAAKGTSFARAVERLFNPLGYIAELEDRLRGRAINWEESSRVLLKVKSDRFPEDLTMAEKLEVAKACTREGNSRST